MQLNNQVCATKFARMVSGEILFASYGAACGGTSERRSQISYLTASLEFSLWIFV